MSTLVRLYPGHGTVEFAVIVVAAVALISGAAWTVSLFLERRPAMRHCVLLSGLVASLASPLLAWAFISSGTYFIVIPLLEAVDSPRVSSEMRGEGPPDRISPREEGGPFAERALPESSTNRLSDGSQDRVVVASLRTDAFRSTVVVILLLWSCGTVVPLVGLARGALFLRRLRRSMQPLSDVEVGALEEAKRVLGAQTSLPVVVSPLARTPLTAGVFRPVIVFPADSLNAITREQLCDALMHELAHVQRLDNLVVLLQAVARTFFWPIPFVHLLNRQLARAREDICDNHVLASRDAVSYGETLLRLAQLACDVPTPLGTVGILQWRGKLEERIFGLIHQGRSKMTRTHPLISGALLVVFVSAAALLCGTTLVAAQDVKREDRPTADLEKAPLAKKKDAKEGPAGPTLQGRITDEKGRPLPGAKVVLYAGFATRWKIDEAVCDSDGRYRFAAVRSSLIKNEENDRWDHFVGMKVVHESHVPSDGESWRDLTIAGTPGHVETLDLKLTPGGVVEGTLVEAGTAKPLAKLDLRLMSPVTGRRRGAKFLAYATTDDAGRFRSQPLFPGEYAIDVNDSVRDYPLLGTVKVEAGKTAQVKFDKVTLPKLLKGVVMGADGKPVSAVELTLLAPADEGVAPTTRAACMEVRSRSWDITRDDGRFTLAFLPGLEKSRMVLAWHKRLGWAKVLVKDLQSGKPVRLGAWNPDVL
jgi:beta-lactamase regulating signal transducer with metallopeptidase domain